MSKPIDDGRAEWVEDGDRGCGPRGILVLALLVTSVLTTSTLSTRAEPPDFYVSGSVRVTIGPDEATAQIRWQLTDEKNDRGDWIPAGDRWASSNDVLAGIPPGEYGVVFETDGAWNPPDARTVYVAPAEDTEQSVLAQSATIYETVSDVPTQNIRHGDTLKFFVASGGSLVRVDTEPGVERDLSFEGGVFTYRPSEGEVRQFTAILSGGGTQQAVVINPLRILPSEADVIEYRGDFPWPESAERKAYLTVSEEVGPARAFNHENQPTRAATISGQRVVFERGHESGLYESFAYADDQIDNDNVASMVIYADQVVVRERVELPSTALTIFARELIFEDTDGVEAAFITTPLQADPARDGFWRDNKPHSPVHGVDGAQGLAAGGAALHVGAITAPGPTTRLVLRGGTGQDGGVGKHGPALNNRTSYTVYNPGDGMPGYPAGYSGKVIGAIFSECCLGCREKDRQGRTSCIRSGWDAVADGASGKGGSAGHLVAPFDLASISDLRVGIYGRGAVRRSGSLGDTPTGARVARNSYNCLGQWGSWSSTNCGNRHGNDQAAKDFVGADPVAGEMRAELEPSAWLHPISVRVMLEYARDAYLNGYPDIVRNVVAPYAVALEAYENPPEEIANELAQLESEVTTILHRLDSNLDYFGFPAGWVPMLSFEVTSRLFQDEVEAAGDILYLTHYLGRAASEATAKVDALTRLRAELSREIAEFKERLSEVRVGFDDLQIKAGLIDQDIRDTGRELERREAELREKAKLNAALKKSFRVLGNTLPLIPVGQPALGLAGAGLTAASKFNEQSALDNAIDGTNIAHDFLGSHMESSLEEYQIAAEGGQAGAAFLARQKALQGFDAALVGVNSTLQEVKTWESDVDREVQILAAEDPEHKDLVEEIKKLNERKREFVEEMVVLIQQAKALMDGINQNSLALDNLNRETVAAFGQIDESAFRYIKEMERRSKDRLLKFQYYLIKAYQYRTVRSFAEVNENAYELGAVFEHFADNFTNDFSPEAGAPILSRDAQPNLVDVYTEQVRQVTAQIVDHLVQEPPEQTDTLLVELDGAQLAKLNAWDDSFGANPDGDLKLNLVELGGLFDQQQENLRIFELTVDELEASPRGASGPARVTVHIQHSGQSLISSKGGVFRFNHYRTLETPPISWRARFDPSTGTHSTPELSAASNSLLETLLSGLEGDVPDDLLLYSRPSAWADLTISKETLSDVHEMQIDKLVLKLRVDFSEKERRQAELDVRIDSDTGEELAANIVVEELDENLRHDGRGAFRRIYRAGERVTLEASRFYGAYRFDRWVNRRGDDVGTGNMLSLTLPLSDSATISRFRAIYTANDGGGGDIYKRGDANADGGANVADAIWILNRLFGDGDPIVCEKTADVNDSGSVNIADPIFLLNHLFGDAETPADPWGSCGADPTPDVLSCAIYTPCL